MIYFIGAGPGDPELITVKGKRLIDEADIIIYLKAGYQNAPSGNTQRCKEYVALTRARYYL